MGYHYISGTRVAVAPGLPDPMDQQAAFDVVDSEGRFVPYVVNYTRESLHSLALDYTGHPIQVNNCFVVVALAGDFAVVPR